MVAAEVQYLLFPHALIGLHHMYSRSLKSSFRAATVVLALTLGLVACSDDEKSADTTVAATVTKTTTKTTTAKPSSTSTTEQEATTTIIDTTTTVATEVLEETTTTVAPVVPVYPLTGVENPDPVIAARPALVVKIGNEPAARPQTGFNAADIVYEEIVNDNITRFALIFQSGNSNPVGPIRSGRLQDVDLFSSYNRPLFSWSGGNGTVTNAINNSELVNIGPNHADVYFRSRDRKAPSNLYSNTDALFARTFLYAPPATQQFSYRGVDQAPAGVASPGVAIKLDSIEVGWTWDSEKGLYFRQMEGRPHMDAASGQVSTNNVVVLAVNYRPGISGSPDAQTLGTGEVFVMTGGNYIHGTWSRDDIHTPFKLIADDGSVIELAPGRTFVELPRVGSTLVLPAE